MSIMNGLTKSTALLDLTTRLLLLLFLVVNPASISHAALQDHNRSHAIVENKTGPVTDASSHVHETHHHDASAIHDHGAAGACLDSDRTCCSAVCAGAIMVSDCGFERPNLSQCIVSDLHTPLITAEPGAPQRPPKT